jgi:hypothetical protein
MGGGGGLVHLALTAVLRVVAAILVATTIVKTKAMVSHKDEALLVNK